jgi:HemY protein
VAEAALDAQLWGEARRHLEEALTAAPPAMTVKGASSALLASPPEDVSQKGGQTGPTPRLCQLMARLEEAEHGPREVMRRWLDRAVTAMPDPRYICSACGGESLEWRSGCPHCGSFDTLLWRTPALVAAGATLPIVAETSWKPPSCA